MSIDAYHYPLKPAQREAFARDGFLIVRGLARAEKIAAMRSLVLEQAEHRIEPLEYEAEVAYPGAPASRDTEGGDTPRRLLQAYDRDPLLAEWATSDQVTGIVGELLGSDTLWLTRNHHNCVMTKHPRFSTATAWHRDLRYWAFQTPRLVNAWLALGDETPENGCMQVLPATHAMDLDAERLDREQFLREDLKRNAALIDTAVEAVLAPGDVLFFDAATLHSAGANTTEQLKLSVVTTYYGADNAPVPGSRSARLPSIPIREPNHA